MSQHDRPETDAAEGLGDLDPDALLRGAADQGDDDAFFFDEDGASSFDHIRAVLEEELAEYRNYEPLGRGGMGVVFRAEHVRLERAVAIKVLLPQRIAPDEMRARFEREAKALAQLQHPNIVTVHDYGEAGGHPYLVMEFVDGASVRDMLDSGRFRPEEALALVPEICEALSYAHEKGVVHRDIKPENLLVDREGRLKIADFGIAMIAEGPQPRQRLTNSRMIMGTPHYMAPEQAERPQEVDHRADIYSLGVVFYEMLTGELPVGIFAPPSEKAKVDVRLDEVVLRTLEKEPDRRYQTAREVKRGITRVEEAPEAPVSRRPGGRAQRSRGSAKRSTASVLAWTLIPGILLGLLIAAIFMFVLRPMQKADEVRRSSPEVPAEIVPAYPEEALSVPERRERLLLAAARGRLPVIRRLLALNTDLNYSDGRGRTALFIAVEAGETEVVKFLLEQEDVRVNVRDRRGSSPLGAALIGNHLDIARLLMKSKQIDLDRPIVKGGRRSRPMWLLDRLFERGGGELIDEAIAAGTKLRPASQTVEKLLAAAKTHGAPFAARFVPILDESFDKAEDARLSRMSAGGGAGTTALGAALLEGYDELAVALLKKGRREMGPGVDHPDLVHAAAAKGLTATLRVLLRAGASAKQRAPNTTSPLHLAARGDHAETCRALLDAGAELYVGDFDWDTPLMYAARADADEVFTLLLGRSAPENLGHTNMSGEDVLDVALAVGNESAARALTDMGIERSLQSLVARALRLARTAEARRSGWRPLVGELMAVRARIITEVGLPTSFPVVVAGEALAINRVEFWIDLAVAYAAARADMDLSEVNALAKGQEPLVLPLRFPTQQALVTITPHARSVEEGDEVWRETSLVRRETDVVRTRLAEMLEVQVVDRTRGHGRDEVKKGRPRPFGF